MKANDDSISSVVKDYVRYKPTYKRRTKVDFQKKKRKLQRKKWAHSQIATK
jgi:hypothetical protein